MCIINILKHQEARMKIGIGIDTGGTCTDAVAYDLENHTLLASAKSLTTKLDLSIGILESLRKLPKELVKEAQSISLSTTLATNACVENKGSKARLFIYGGEEDYIFRLGAKSGEFKPEDFICIDTKTTYEGRIRQMPDWDKISELLEGCKDCEAIATVEIYCKQTAAKLEKKTKELAMNKLQVPVVCGYELFDNLDFIRRGNNALLNAKLVPVIDKFLKAIDESLEVDEILVKPAIVRSDGTLMSREFAKYHPVETLLCGPVASVMGAKELVQADEAIVLDMGGTTTDIAFIKKGQPLHAKDGIQIGNWRTFVKGLYVETFGLGGDSAVCYNSEGMYLDERRVVPTCIIASEYPFILEELEELHKMQKGYTRPLHEYYILQKDISGIDGYNEEEQKICEILKDGPKSMKSLADELKIPVYNLNTENLERNGILMRSGLTPTDIMHIKGDYTAYDAKASFYAASFVARSLGMTPEELGDCVYNAVKKKMYCSLAAILLKQQFKEFTKNGISSQVSYLIEESWDQYVKNPTGAFDVGIHLQVPTTFIGLGGPIGIFLEDVATAFGATAIVPKHASVANAIGAVISNVSFEVEVLIHLDYPIEGGDITYIVYSRGDSVSFETLEEAREYADERVHLLANEEAISRGVTKNAQIVYDNYEKYYDSTTMLQGIYYKALVSEG